MTARIAPHVSNGHLPQRVHYYIFNVINYYDETADADFLLAHNQHISGVVYYWMEVFKMVLTLFGEAHLLILDKVLIIKTGSDNEQSPDRRGAKFIVQS